MSNSDLLSLAERVVVNLSPEQRADILAADEGDAYCPHFSRLYGNDATHQLVDAYPAHHDPDCSADDDHGTRWSFTPLGKQVRAIASEVSK